MSRATTALGLWLCGLSTFVVLAVAGALLILRTFNVWAFGILVAGFLGAILGALLVEPDATKAALHSLSSEAGPYIPGGRRASDPIVRPPSDEAKG